MRRRWTILLLLVLAALVLTACNLPSSPPPVVQPPPAAGPTNTSPPPPPPPTNTPEPLPTEDPYAGIEHTDIPVKSVLTYWAYDCDTGRYTPAGGQPKISSGCDVWQNNFVERPVSQDLSLFYPHLDINRFQMGKDETWLYADISTFAQEGASTVLNGSYGLELDFDSDGQGDVLVKVDDPSQFPPGEWHARGVQVWEDANNDLGSDTRVYADSENTSDGYEAMLFDQGLGDDPDLAWARISPDDPATVEFALKRTIIPGGVGAFVWWTWASQQPLDPALFDYVDSFSEDELYQIGNSCRWIFDGPPQPVPNVCPYQQPTLEPPDRETTYCWVQPVSSIAVFPAVCQVCPNPCPADSLCYGSCTP